MASATGYSTGASSVGAVGGGVSEGDDEGYSVTKLKEQYLSFQNAKDEEIREQRVARHYFHGDQLTAEELRVLKKRRQPAVIRNVIDRKINGVVGLIERLRQDPKGYARSPQEEERGGAEVASESVRYTLDKPNDDEADWASASAEVVRSGAINGIFGIEFALEKGDHGDPDITYAMVDADTFFYDPRSVRYSFSDARFMGVAKWVDLDVAQEMFPDQAELLAGLVSYGSGLMQSTNQQQDRERRWVDTNRKRLFLVEHWHISKGEWFYCFYVGDQKIRAGRSMFENEKGRTVSRYVMDTINIDHDGDRYGFVRPLKPRQDEFNARGSKALHTLNVRRIKLTKGSVDDIEVTRQEAVRPDGVIEVNPGGDLEFDDAKSAADFAGQLELMAEVKEEIENFGPNPALIGQGIENKSGRAIALLQQAGIAELGPAILNVRRWKLRVYRFAWNAQQQHWTAERWIRVTDDERVQNLIQRGLMDEQTAPFLAVNQMKMTPLGMPTIANNLGALDVDIILDEGPDTITLMQDTYDTLQAMAQAGAQIPPEILIELSPVDARTKRKLLQIAAKANQPDPQAQQLQLEDATATVQGKRAKAAKDMAGARKTMAEVPGEGAKATRDKAAALRDVIGAATDLHNARQPPPSANGRGDGARPSDGGLGQLQ
jgi:hypothetical protein